MEQRRGKWRWWRDVREWWWLWSKRRERRRRQREKRRWELLGRGHVLRADDKGDGALKGGGAGVEDEGDAIRDGEDGVGEGGRARGERERVDDGRGLAVMERKERGGRGDGREARGDGACVAPVVGDAILCERDECLDERARRVVCERRPDGDVLVRHKRGT